ncbi:MAG: hypothetical protein HXX11_18195 [Desulfuromonadales bacterium]|nr:hypothetical protein [Desulfuromonadales bacterium]
MKTLIRFAFRLILVTLILSIAVLVLPLRTATAALFENYQIGNGQDAGLSSPNVWLAQTFTASSNHTVKYVQLYGERDASLTTGSITVSIRATDTEGQPAGADLTAASEVVTTIPINYGWFTIYLPTCSLVSGARYAIVVRISNASASAGFYWSGDTVKAYPTGAGFNSVNGGSSWIDGGIDLMFTIYGDATVATAQTAAPTADSYPGFTDWFGPTQAYTNGDGYTRAGKNVTHYYHNFNFSIPTGATINGIEVRLDAWYYPTGWPPSGTGNFRAALSWNHGTTITSFLSTANVTASEATYFIGGSASTWGRTWNSGDFTNGNFEIQLTPITNTSIVTYPNQALSLDYCQVTVYYTPPQATTPTVSTQAISGITGTTATGGGTITSDGGAAVTAKGACWGTSANPTLENSCTNDGSGTSSFTSSITALNRATTYHVRAYATNAVGTSYGSDLTFSTDAPLTVTLQGVGSGRLNSTAPDINCSSGSCNQDYPFSSIINLTPNPAPHSQFSTWSGDCSGATIPCPITMDQSRTVLATFDINPAEAVWIDPGENYFNSINTAYQAAGASALIKACRVSLTENLLFNQGKTITLSGGYNSSYSDNSGLTTVNGTLTLASGSVSMGNFVIR